jgi:hypothetical protein
VTTSNHLAPLPIQLRPHSGETAESFVVRLALANHLKPSYLRRYITPGRQGMGAIDTDKLAIVIARTPPVVRHLFPELAAREKPPRRPGVTAERRKRKQHNDNTKRLVYAAIRRDAAAGKSARAIERKHGVGWRTVHSALESPNPPARKKYPARERPTLDGLIAHIDALLAATPAISAREVWESLLDEHHVAVTYQSVSSYLRTRRGPAPRPPLPVTGEVEIPTVMTAPRSRIPSSNSTDPISTQLIEMTLEMGL